MSNKVYTEDEVVKFAETLGYLYKFDNIKKTWRMETNLAPGLLNETTKQLIHRLIDTSKDWDKRMKELRGKS
jgi:hypothetical protein